MAKLIRKGGKGSGNWGHAGRPGKVGGSSKRGEPAAIYYRYLMSKKQINDDIQRGYGFRYYDLYETVHDLVEKSPFVELYDEYWDVIEEYDVDELSEEELLSVLLDAGIDIRQDIPGTGMWGLAYNGLSAFGDFTTVEEAENEARTWHYGGFDNQQFTHFAIVEGEPTGSVDDNDMDTILVKKIIKLVRKH